MTRTCISIVLPVYNEQANIAECLRGLWGALSAHEHEILVCYDFDADQTLPAIAAMPDRPPSVRLVKNTIGRGAPNAIRAGFQAAEGDVVVTTMADLSDPPEVIPRMAAAIREQGAAVVSGSRYMRGGSQQGGPLLKRILSQTASWTLRWCTGMTTLDATSNFRAYAKSFLERVTVESKAGFEIALELTIKAHMLGLKIAEVPSSWRDRSAGQSRFRMWKWMPNYLRWYGEAMAAPLFVFGLWAAMTWLAVIYLRLYSSTFPFWDDFELAQRFRPNGGISLAWLWSQHNEHRLFLPRLIIVPLIEWTREWRAPMYMQVFILAALALAFVLAMRARRGRTVYADAFFPLLLLHWGNAPNFAWAFQLTLVVPIALVCVFLLVALRRQRIAGSGAALVAGLALVGLPLCGVTGLAYAPVLSAWSLAWAWSARRSGSSAERRGGAVLAACALVSCGLVALYFRGFEFPGNNVHGADAATIAATAVKFLSLSVGPAARDYWPLPAILVGIATLSALLLLSGVWRTRAQERWRASALLACMLGVVVLAVCVGWGRGGMSWGAGFADRYVMLPAALLACVYCAWTLYDSPPFGTFMRVSMCSAMVVLFSYNLMHGLDRGRRHMLHAGLLAQDIEKGMTPAQLSARHWQSFFSNQQGFTDRLRLLAKANLAPFKNHGPFDESQDVEDEFFMFKTRPTRAHPRHSLAARTVNGIHVLLFPPEGTLEYELSAPARVVRGKYGILPLAMEHGRTDGVRFVIELVRPGAPPRVLLERALDPMNVEADRTLQEFDLPIEAEPSDRILLRTTNTPGSDEEMDWSYWADVEIR